MLLFYVYINYKNHKILFNNYLEILNIFVINIKEFYYINKMTERTFIITNPKIIDFIHNHKLLNFENLILQTIEEYSNQKAGNVLISVNEITQIYQEYQNILNCKKNFENISKEIKINNCKIKSTTIENFCSKHLNIKHEVFSCDSCNKFYCSTKKGLQTHMRKCMKQDKEILKNNNDYKEENEEEENEENEENEEDENEEENEEKK